MVYTRIHSDTSLAACAHNFKKCTRCFFSCCKFYDIVFFQYFRVTHWNDRRVSYSPLRRAKSTIYLKLGCRCHDNEHRLRRNVNGWTEMNLKQICAKNSRLYQGTRNFSTPEYAHWTLVKNRVKCKQSNDLIGVIIFVVIVNYILVVTECM